MRRIGQWWQQRRRRAPGSGRRADAALVVGLVVALVLVVLAVRSTSDSADDPGIASTGAPVLGSGDGSTGPTGGTTDGSGRQDGPGARLQRQVVDALAATSYPRLDPPASALGTASWARAAQRTGCLDVTPADLQRCRFDDTGAKGAGRGLVVVLGDDDAIGYLPAVRAALGADFRVQQLTLRGCPVWDAPIDRLDGSPYTQCDLYRQFTLDEVARLKPDLLVLASSFDEAALLTSGATDTAALDEVQAGYDRSLAALTPSARFTVVLQGPPGGVALSSCYRRGGSPADCVKTVPGAYDAAARVETGVAAAAGATYVAALPWLCAGGACPAFVGRTPVYADGLHLTAAYSARLGPALRAALDDAAAGS